MCCPLLQSTNTTDNMLLSSSQNRTRDSMSGLDFLKLSLATCYARSATPLFMDIGKSKLEVGCAVVFSISPHTSLMELFLLLHLKPSLHTDMSGLDMPKTKTVVSHEMWRF
jgi:hypothetical protein